MSRSPDRQPFAALIGIDWADEQHDVAIKTIGSGEVVRKTINHSPEALVEWVQELRERFQGRPVAVCLEQSRGALINALMAYEFIHLFPIPPARLSQYRQSMTSSGAKSDPVDTDLILDFLEKHADKLHEWKPDDELTRRIRFLCELRRRLVDDRTRLSNRLKAVLKGYFPQVIGWLNDELHTRLATDFLGKWPTLEALQRAKPHTIRRFFYGHNSRRPDRLKTLLEEIRKAQPLTSDRATVECAVIEVQALAKQLQDLTVTITRVEKELGTSFGQHEDAAIFQSLPGAGDAIAPRLLSAYGTDRERFPDAESMQVLSGIAPVTIGSGTRKNKVKRGEKKIKKQRKIRVQRRYARPKFVHQTFHEFAAQTVRWSIWSKACYRYLRDRGHDHHAALRVLAFKWIRIITSLWHQRATYDEAKYIAALRRRKSPLVAYLPPEEHPASAA